MARGENLENAEVPRWGVFGYEVVEPKETAGLEGLRAECVEVEFFGAWYHRAYQITTPKRPIRVLIPRETFRRMADEFYEHERNLQRRDDGEMEA